VLEVIRGSSLHPVASGRLANTLIQSGHINGVLYIGYPVLGSPEGPFRIDALLLSPEKGVVIFDLVEGRSIGDAAERQDLAYRRMQAKLLQNSSLSRRRELAVEISTITFSPAAPATLDLSQFDDDHPVAIADDSLVGIVDSIQAPLDASIYNALVSVIQTVTTIRTRAKKRGTKNEHSRGSIAARLESSIATLDAQQSSAVIQTIEGVQHIRGLAGSGKTIVLALKVAYLHAQNPDWKIGVTFATRSLKGVMRNLIYTFVVEQTGHPPDFDNVEIMNAWGAAGSPDREGVYYKFCKLNELTYLDFGMAKNQVGASDAFNHACKAALSAKETFAKVYDAIVVDEAQDFAPSFLKLCYEFLKPPKRLVYAFDELQSLSADAGMPPPEEIFGKDPNGQPLVRFAPPNSADGPRQDIVLEKCYRNSRPILVTAHALGFGIYRKDGLVQMFGDAPLWEDIGYRVRDGELADGKHVRLARSPETSPVFLEEHSPLEDIVVFRKFESESAQAAAIVADIARNLNEDELEPDDIIVINAEAATTRSQVAQARELLFEQKIKSELAGVSSSPDVFFSEGAVVFTGIFRAKGNEAPMVYVMNAQHCASGSRIDIKRNILFTAITRSKAWVRIYGVGPRMDALESEFAAIRERDFELDFRYPTEAERTRMRIYHRQDRQRQQQTIKNQRRQLSALVQALQDDRISSSDIPADLREKLKDLLR
jgi:superfamily I DNA and RNA helicase